MLQKLLPKDSWTTVAVIGFVVAGFVTLAALGKLSGETAASGIFSAVLGGVAAWNRGVPKPEDPEPE